MTSVPELNRIAEGEEWTVDTYDFEVKWDEAARAEFAADPAGFLRRLIESAYSRQPGSPEAVNQVLIGEELLDLDNLPSQMRCRHVKVPAGAYSTHTFGAAT